MPAAKPKPGFPAQLGALGKLLLLIPVGAIIALIGSFLPVVSISAFGETYSVTYWAEGADGPIILICSIVAIVAAAIALAQPAKWSYIVAGVAGILSQILLFVSAFTALSRSAELDVPLGPAPFLLLVGAIMVVVGAIVTIIGARKL